MTSISGIGSSISNFFTTGSTSSTKSSTSTTNDESSSTTDTSNGYLGNVLGVLQTTGIMGLPTTGAPGDSDLLLAEIELKLQKTINQTRDNSALSVAIAADMKAIAGQVQNINAAETAIDADNKTITTDTDALNNTYLPLQQSQLTAMNTADSNLTNAQNTRTSASNKLTADSNDIVAKTNDAAAQLAIINSKTSTQAAKATATGKYNADEAAIQSDGTDQTTQQNTINQENDAINGVNGQPGLQSIASSADAAYAQTSATVKSLQGAVSAATADLTTQATNIANADTAIKALVTDLAFQLSASSIDGRGIVDQENEADGQNYLIDRQFEKISDALKKLVDVDTMVQQAQNNQDQMVNQDAIDRTVLAAAGLVGGLLDLVNTLSSLTPVPDADAGSQSYATGGSRLKIGV